MSGIKAHTLRIWELRYGILKPQRTSTNIRYYNNNDLRRILNIAILNKNGYKISGIAGLDDTALVKEVEKYLNNYLRDSSRIESLYLSLLDMDEAKIENTVNTAILSLGFENTIEKMVFPFLHHLGNMWQVGAISSAQEHFISNLIRQKLIVGLDKLVPDHHPSPKTFLFFLPNSELHELGLLYACYLAKSKGHKCIYLGQSVPLEDLVSISRTTLPHYLVSILTSRLPDNDLVDFLESCCRELETGQFLLSGRLLLEPGEKIPLAGARYSIFEDFPDFKKWL